MKSSGPRSSSLIPIAASASAGDVTTSPTAAPTTSLILLPTTRASVDAVRDERQRLDGLRHAAQRLGRAHDRAIAGGQKREVGRLRVEREEAVDRQLGRADPPGELVLQLPRAPVADVEERPGLAEATLACLVPQALRAVEVRHLDQRLASGLEHAPDLVERRQRVVLREVLEDAVRKHDVDALVGKGKMPGVADDVLRVDAELVRDAASGLHALERRVEPRRGVPAANGGDAPASPVRPELEKAPALAGRT